MNSTDIQDASYTADLRAIASSIRAFPTSKSLGYAIKDVAHKHGKSLVDTQLAYSTMFKELHSQESGFLTPNYNVSHPIDYELDPECVLLSQDGFELFEHDKVFYIHQGSIVIPHIRTTNVCYNHRGAKSKLWKLHEECKKAALKIIEELKVDRPNIVPQLKNAERSILNNEYHEEL